MATFNILHGRSVAHGEVLESDLRGAAAQIDADIIGLQEVDRCQPRSGGLDQTATVAAALGAPYWLFLPTLLGLPGSTRAAAEGDPDQGPAHGVGLVSRLPVQTWGVRRFGPAPVGMPLMVSGRRGLTHVEDEPRIAIAARVETPMGLLTVVTAHLSFVPGWNVAQLRDLGRWARTMPGPRVLMGDFNLPGALPRLATGWASPARVRTYPSWRPRVQLDHVLLDGLPADAVSGARAVRTAVSDHCALVLDL